MGAMVFDPHKERYRRRAFGVAKKKHKSALPCSLAIARNALRAVKDLAWGGDHPNTPSGL